MNYIAFLNLVKDLEINVFDSHISIWVNPDGDQENFFNWINRCMFLGFSSGSNGRSGEIYRICFKCTYCGDRFCYH